MLKIYNPAPNIYNKLMVGFGNILIPQLMRHFYFLVLLILATSFSQLNADILYVKPGTSSTAWQNQTNVYSDLQSALAAAVAGDEVWVAAGIYKPTDDGDRTISFELKDGVHYYGGFVGNETELSQRDWNTNKTILSGDIGVEGDSTDNSRTIVYLNEAADVSADYRTFFDGFIVEDGYGYEGAGFYLEDGNPIIKNCWIRENYVTRTGGGVYSDLDARPVYGNVIFSNNYAENGGAGVFAYRESSFYNCIWYGNNADYESIIHSYTTAIYVYNSIAIANVNRDDSDQDMGSYSYNSLLFSKPISYDPLFVNAEYDDFRLAEGSAAVNKGANDNVPAWLDSDFGGNDRILDETVDIGVFEGTVKVPQPNYPNQDSLLNSDVSDVDLTWSDDLSDVDSYTLEYQINDEPTYSVSDISSKTYNISSLQGGDKVIWRVAAVLSSGETRWSSWRRFYISRGHPLYVTPNGEGNGASWADAMSLTTALDVAFKNDSIWVASGTYFPTNGTDRDESFVLKEGIVLLGGFQGNESSAEERNNYLNKTILSGDIGESDNSTDNSYNVVRIVGDEWSPISNKTILDGFTVEGGYGDSGAGLFLDFASPVIRNVWFRGNYANSYGGAVYANHDCKAVFGNVIFEKNISRFCGGAVYSYQSELSFYNCSWFGNRAEDVGGSVYGYCNIVNSISWGNYSGEYYDDFTYEGGVANSIYNTNVLEQGVISEDPMFVAPEKGDFRLQEESPAIDLGNNDVPFDWLLTDFMGNPRNEGERWNAGAIESTAIPPVLFYPSDGEIFTSGRLDVLLEWRWPSSRPDDVVSYSVEYQINDADPVLEENLTDPAFSLLNVPAPANVTWRACSVNDEGIETWTRESQFLVTRGHPIFVTVNGSGDGSSWTNAASLTDAIDMCVKGDSIWVAAGTYYPTSDADREVSFNIDEGVKIFGGFAGTEDAFFDRNWNENKTVLSGNIGDPALKSDNSKHVLKVIGTPWDLITENTIIDGLTIEEGYFESWSGQGAGAYLKWGKPLFKNVWFRDNYVGDEGGAVYGGPGSEARFISCLFTDNESNYMGGAVYSLKLLHFVNCVWYQNKVNSDNRIVYGSINVTNSIFFDNSGNGSTDNIDFSGNVNLTNSISFGVGNYNGNISENPGFVNPQKYDFRLMAESPAINAGETEAVTGYTNIDYAGNARVLEDTVDIGLFEGSVIVPSLLSPQNDSVFVNVDNNTVSLEWTLVDSIAKNVSEYQLEYILNEDTISVNNIQGMSYELDGIVPNDQVKWRIGYTAEYGYVNWSEMFYFSVYRGHPLYVIPEGTGEGSSWTDGIGLQSALETTLPGDTLWLSAGIYKPTTDDDRRISFIINKDVKVFGGFAGTETSLEQRDWNKNKTILSGNIGDVAKSSDNSFNVVKMEGPLLKPLTNACVLDGVIIESGFADDYYSTTRNGGGLNVNYAAPIVRNVWFRSNYADLYGGAVYLSETTAALFGNVLFADNKNDYYGGAVYDEGAAEFFNCIWYGNFSEYGSAVEGSSQVFNSIGWNNTNRYENDDNFDSYNSVVNSIDSESVPYNYTPGFVAPDEDDFRIREGSPGINSGDTIPAWLTTDFWGAPRVAEDTVDIGLMEGYVITPKLISPADESYFNADSLKIQLEWGWADSIPDNITGYELEYCINNGDSVLVDILEENEFLLTDLEPADVVHWRVCSVEESGLKNWSPFYKFTIYRDHPLYVKPDATGNGTSWLSPMDLKDALKIAIRNDEIWVASGTYRPTNENDRDASFQIREGIDLYGGFGGFESSKDERDWFNNKTILSGDIGVLNDSTDNVRRVVDIEADQDSVVVDGLIIEDGYVYSWGGDGAGMRISAEYATIKNTWFRNNYAYDDGGAVIVSRNSNAYFYNVIFEGNESQDEGGAVYNSSFDFVEFNNCIWYGNIAGNRGGAIFTNYVKILNSIFWNNLSANDYDDFNSSYEVYNSIYKDADPANENGNISEDPLFVDAENGNFFLQPSSPAINKGNNQYVPEQLDTDFSGFSRIFGENVDIGVYENKFIEHITPASQGSGTYEFSVLGFVELTWGLTDGMMEPDPNISNDIEYQLKLWKEGDEANPIEDGSFVAGDGLPGNNNNTYVWQLEYGNTYNWSIGLDYGDYVVWSEPTVFYIGHDHTIKVKEGSNGTSGATWDDAFGTLTEALDYAIPGDEIWVAEGTYYPVTPADASNVTADERAQALSLKPGLLIYGGLAGDESYAWDRNHVEHPVILSGDIGVAGDDSDNSIHLFRNEFDAGAPLGQGAVIEGFIFEDATGSAIYNVNASPSIEFSVFRNNSGEDGGAVYNDGSSPRFFNVLFHDNEASGSGGAIFADGDSKPELLSCTVAHNSASNTGGLYGTFDVKNSIVYANQNGAFSNAASQVVYSCVEGGYEGEENISYDPMWTDPENRDYSLQMFSPCIEQGNNKWFTGLYGYDLAKNSRTHWITTDMGAFEATENGKLEIVESSVVADGLTDFTDSITIRFNQPIAVDSTVLPVLNPDVETELRVSTEDPTVLVISHPGLQSSKDYHLELPGGQVMLANNDKIIQWFVEFNFTTRACIPVELSTTNPDVAVCPRTSVTLEADVSGDALNYFWVFNQEDTLSRDVDSLLIDTVMPENTGEYMLKATDWCGSSDEVSVNLQYKSGTEIVVPAPKWNTVYFVDNNTGNLSDFKWYFNGEEVGTKQYLETKSLDYGELTVVAYDEASQCLVYGEVGALKSVSLKSLSVSPNPVMAGNPVAVILPQISEKSRIRLYDLKGSLLIDQEYGEGSILQLKDTDLASGVYLMQIEYNDGFIENKKLIIE